MLKQDLITAINEQMVYEFESGYLYLGLAAKLEEFHFAGMAHWVRVQADEELLHADLFYRYLIDNEAVVELADIRKPELKVENPTDVFKAALGHEKKVTARINDLAGLALKKGDFSTLTFLNFFLKEQLDEERSVQLILDRITLAGKSLEAMLFIDSELEKRPVASLSL